MKKGLGGFRSDPMMLLYCVTSVRRHLFPPCIYFPDMVRISSGFVYRMWALARVIAGSIAGALKIPTWIITALARGSAPPKFTPQPSLKADAVPELPLRDVELTSSDGTRLHAVTDDGAKRVAGKRPIVFVHGYPEAWWSYVPQLRFFIAAGHPVLALSMRGYGASDKPKGIHNYHIYNCLTKDISAAVNYMADPNTKPLLVAHDWGAGVSWAYVSEGVSKNAWDVAGYVSLSNPPGECFKSNMGARQMWASIYMVFFNMPWLPELVFKLSNAWVIGLMLNDTWSVRREPRWLDLYRTDKLQPEAMRAQTDYYRAAIQLGARPEKGNILRETNKLQLPVLMVRGKQDIALLGSIFTGYEKILAKAKLIELDACSHWITVDKPDETCAAIASFLAEL